ncbi:copper binding protein, plastocyanin/azurin family [Cenarchaeum symbiosum A]|uniref:Copper binding protein, plastocyanin/azurin family n=1 Tax=Cenarchaeum symbiosum (strain A) TaxID=414004 RepID=A0RUZ6_CENSY|nr:copper binding protein, plastocyanin/azurin family [Cenarchaeum symbiosum A]
MSNWDLMMPGMGLTAIGLAGVVVSYAGIAHTFIDGMHALTGLTMFVGLIFLSAGILEGGVSTSNKAKATTLVILAISLSFGTAALVYNTISTVQTFASIMMILAVPAIVIAYMATKMPEYLKPVGVIFCLAIGLGVVTFVALGMIGPGTYLIDEPEEAAAPAEAPAAAPAPDAPVFDITILEGSGIPDTPDYDPDVATVLQGTLVVWTNVDPLVHTVTSTAGLGETFDSGLISEGDVFSLDTRGIDTGVHEYTCIVHPWMVSTLVVEEPEPEPEEPVIAEP